MKLMMMMMMMMIYDTPNLRNANMKAYLGETKFKMLEEFGAIKEKYGSQPTKCENDVKIFQT